MKKIIALLLAVMMLVSIASCGNTNDTNTDTNTDGQVNENVNDETNADTNTDANTDTNTDGETLGQTLAKDFKDRVGADSTLSAQAIADELVKNPVLQFGPAVMPIEEGLLTGFDNAEIKGFKEGVMFAPMIGTIPFVGYVFVLEDGTDIEGFKTTLSDNANMRWNICTEAEEKVVENVGNTVFFLMCPKSLEA